MKNSILKELIREWRRQADKSQSPNHEDNSPECIRGERKALRRCAKELDQLIDIFEEDDDGSPAKNSVP